MMRFFTSLKLAAAVLFVVVGFSLNAQNLVTNGDFESWTAGAPDGWTTIESGIIVTEETTIIHGGSKSASIDVITGTQGDTDFRQTISVVGGTDYLVSVWVYHTEGALKARMYVDTYLGYSDNTITGDWQEMTYSFTAAATEDIEIGLRFYDQSGFDGAEIVYVDDYLIEEDVTLPGPEVTIYKEEFVSDLGTTSGYSVTGPQVWEYATFGIPAGCAKMTGYDGSSNIENEDWLITPSINCDNYENITLRFDHARNYADNSGLSILISTDYDGSSDPSTNGTWTDLTSQFTFPATGGWNFIDAGTVDISTEVGSSTYVAFKYTSTTSDAATWEVDNIHIEGEPTITAFIAGNFTNWVGDSSDFEMSLNANGLLELTKNLPAGDNEYKVVYDGNWYPSGDNQHIILTADADTTWKFNYNATLVTHALPTVTGNFLDELGGTDWDVTELLAEMEDPEGDDIYTFSVTIPVAGNYECKVVLNRNWDQSTGGNTPFISDGVNPTTFTYDFVNNTTTVSGPPPPAATVTFSVVDTAGMNYDGFNLKGSWDVNGFYDPGWGGGNEHSMLYDDGTNGDTVAGDHIWMCEQVLVVDGGSNTWEWGVNDTEHNWIAGNWQFMVADDSPQNLEWVVPDEPALIINEIMYNSIGADQEWIELYNNTDASIDLENWKVLDSDATHSAILIPAGHSIAAGGYFTIAVEGPDPFPFTPDYDGRGNFALNNGGDVVRLWNANNILVDIVSYSDSDPWPTEPDGDGPSLALIDPATDNSLPQNWAASLEEGGSPGAENFPPIPFVDVTSPDGGEYVERGAYFEITWVYGFWDGQIKIELKKGDENPELIVSNIALSGGSYNWFVPVSTELGDDFKLVISGLVDGDPVGESDDYFSIIEPYVIPDIVISEIMYNPPESGDDTLEFVEFYNNTDEIVNLEGYFMSQGVDYIFPNIDINPDTFMLLAKDSLAMMATFGVESRQWTAGGLNNGGEPVELSDSFGNVVDYVPYEDSYPWDSLADGYGPSLTLCNPNWDNELPESWTHSVNLAAINTAGDSIYATPGFECQVEFLAGFEGYPTTLPVGDSVMFTDETIGSPISWSWTFEGGTPETFSGQTPPYIVYNEIGMFDVTLVVSDGVNTDSITAEDYINVGLPPVADFEAEDLQVLAGSYTNFFDLSEGEELTYQWYFEGATPDMSTDQNPTDIYYLIMDWAEYDVTLVVTNPFGSDSLTKEDYIEVVPEGIDDMLNDRNVSLYPNPNTGQFTLALPDGIDVDVNILDVHGKSVYHQSINASDVIDLGTMNKGIYLVRILDTKNESLVIKRLVIR